MILRRSNLHSAQTSTRISSSTSQTHRDVTVTQILRHVIFSQNISLGRYTKTRKNDASTHFFNTQTNSTFLDSLTFLNDGCLQRYPLNISTRTHTHTHTPQQIDIDRIFIHDVHSQLFTSSSIFC